MKLEKNNFTTITRKIKVKLEKKNQFYHKQTFYFEKFEIPKLGFKKKRNSKYRLIGRRLTCASTAKLHYPSHKTHHHYLQMHSTPHTAAVTAWPCARNPPLKVCQTEACHFNTSLACLAAAAAAGKRHHATRVKQLTKAWIPVICNLPRYTTEIWPL